MNQKTKLLLSAICLFAISGTAQISFVEHIIVGRDDLPQPRNARKVIAVDIDGDKDKDVLSVSTYYGTIVWFENLGGIGNFSTQKIIALDLPSINTIDVADVDGDGDVDIISGSRTPDANDGKTAFFLNDGQGNFGEEQILHIGGKRVYAVQFADLDGDGHPDALWGTISGEVGWQKNENGMGTFGESQVVSAHTVPVEVLTAHDMDGDGDLDVLAAYSAFNIPSQASIRWYENLDGVGNFGSPIVLSPFDDVILDMVVVDMNKDGRDDLLYGSYNDRIAWFPSTDGMGNFGEEILISTRTKEVTSIFPVDVNGDGDVD
ncbi:MAG: VCBS repeat-containing protein, partial [Bacteroidota bacterium]